MKKSALALAIATALLFQTACSSADITKTLGYLNTILQAVEVVLPILTATGVIPANQQAVATKILAAAATVQQVTAEANSTDSALVKGQKIYAMVSGALIAEDPSLPQNIQAEINSINAALKAIALVYAPSVTPSIVGLHARNSKFILDKSDEVKVLAIQTRAQADAAHFYIYMRR